MRFLARPFGVFFFSCFSTFGVCDLTLPARAREPWTSTMHQICRERVCVCARYLPLPILAFYLQVVVVGTSGVKMNYAVLVLEFRQKPRSTYEAGPAVTILAGDGKWRWHTRESRQTRVWRPYSMIHFLPMWIGFPPPHSMIMGFHKQRTAVTLLLFQKHKYINLPFRRPNSCNVQESRQVNLQPKTLQYRSDSDKA